MGKVHGSWDSLLRCLYESPQLGDPSAKVPEQEAGTVGSGWARLRDARLYSYKNVDSSARSMALVAKLAREILKQAPPKVRGATFGALAPRADDSKVLSSRRRKEARALLADILDVNPANAESSTPTPDSGLIEAIALLLWASVSRAQLPLAPSRSKNLLAPVKMIAGFDVLCLWADSTWENSPSPLHALTFLGRGRASVLLGDYGTARLDYARTEYLVRDYLRMDSNLGGEDEREQVLWLVQLVLADVATGDALFDSFDYEACFNNYCRAVRRVEKTLGLRSLVGISPVVVRVKIQKGKVFLENGRFKRGVQWLLDAMVDLASLEGCFSADGETESDRQKALDGLKNVRAYLDSEASGSRVDKLELAELLSPKHIPPPSEWLRSSDLEYPRLWSDAANRLGFALGLMRLPLPAQDVAGDWLKAALDLDPHNTLARYDHILLLVKQLIESKGGKEELAERLWGALGGTNSGNTVFHDNPERTAAMWLLVRKAFGLHGSLNEPAAPSPWKGDAKSLRLATLEDAFARLLTDIGNIVTRPEETAQYLMRQGAIRRETEELKEEGGCLDRFVCLRRWNSFTPRLPRPRVHSVRGGGYLLLWKGKGIVVDPGFDFIENLYDCGYSLEDVDAVVVTHAHVDHTDDLDALLTLVYERNDYIRKAGLDKHKKKFLDLFMNQGSFERYSSWLAALETVASIHTLPNGWTSALRDRYAFDLTAVYAHHKEIISNEFAIGLRFDLFSEPSDDEPAFRIGITGDTGYYEANKSEDGELRPCLAEHYAACDLVFAHLGSVTLKELTSQTHFQVKIDDVQELSSSLDKLCRRLSSNVTPDAIAVRLGFRDFDDLCALQEKPGSTSFQPKNHLGLVGVMEILDAMASHTRSLGVKNHRALVLTEFPEELGSFRHVLAGLLDARNRGPRSKVRCLTGDIGLSFSLVGNSRKPKRIDERTPVLAVRCRECAQHANISYEATYTDLQTIHETCIRGEAEGMAYYCKEHNPVGENRSYFVEQAKGSYYGLKTPAWLEVESEESDVADSCDE